VTYGGQPLTLQVDSSGSNPVDEIWTLVAPPSGTATIMVTYPGTVDMIGGSVSFAGVDQATPIRASNQARASAPMSVMISTTVTSAAGDVLIDAVAGAGGVPLGLPAAGQTPQWVIQLSGILVGGGSTKPGTAGSTTMTWTLQAIGNISGALAALALIPAPPPSSPTITKAFGAASIPLNGTTSLSFTITNPNPSTSLTGVAFTDTLPAGLVVATPNGLMGTCDSGTITATAGSGSIMLTGATLAPSGSCTFSVTVQGTSPGEKDNSVTVTSNEGGSSPPATASLIVGATPIPTLSTWAFVLLVLLLATLALRRLQVRRAV